VKVGYSDKAGQKDEQNAQKRAAAVREPSVPESGALGLATCSSFAQAELRFHEDQM
jgi:hypothetical protein